MISKSRNKLHADENLKTSKTSGSANWCELMYLNHTGLPKDLMGQFSARIVAGTNQFLIEDILHVIKEK